MNESDTEAAINVRSDGYFIARAVGICPQCRGATRLMALMLPSGHECRSTGDDDDQWDRVPRHALLFYIESLPEPVRGRLQTHAPSFRRALDPATQESYWANHCERCGAFQQDHELFCEPEGAFLPIDPAAGAAIELLFVRESLEASAAGHAIDPPFIEYDAGE